MAQTGRLGTADSQLANLQLALAGANPPPPATDTQSGRLGGQLGDTVLALGGVVGASVIHVATESVVPIFQTPDPAPTFAPHASPLWALGGQDAQLGDMRLAFAGADVPLPAITTQSGRLGGQLGDLVPGLGGLVGPGVIHLSAGSVLTIFQTPDPAPTFASRLSPAWVLGGRDAQLGVAQPAFAGAEEARPATGDQTGQLGTLNSLLGNMRPALGEEEGGGGANIVYTSSDSDLSLADEAAASVVLRCAASSPLALSDAAEAARAVVCNSADEITLLDAAARNNLASGSAESPVGLADTADFTAARAVAAESTLVVTDAAAHIGGQLIEAAADSTLVLDVAAGFSVARTAAAESTLAFVDAAARNDLFSGSTDSAISLATTADFTAVRTMAVESVLALSTEAALVLPAVIDVAAESTISLTGAAGRNEIVAAAAESVLDATDGAACVHVVPTPVAAESAVELGTTVACAAVRAAWAWDFLWELGSWAEVAVVRAVSAQNTVALSQTEQTARPWYLLAESAVQTVTQEYDPEVDDLVDRIEGLQDAASVALPRSLAVSQPIPLGQSASVVRVKATAIDVSAESVLGLLGEIRTNQLGNAGTWLAFTQSAVVDKCKLLRSALELTAEAAVARSGLRGAASALNLGQSATYYLVSSGILQRYHPFVGDGAPGAPTPPALELEGPRPGVTAPFQLVYPAGGPVTDSVTLRSPNFGNKDRLGFNRVLRETRGGTLIVFADPMWPKIQTLVLNFSGLTSDQAQELLTFLEAHLGEEVGVYDWEHRYWTGVITTPTDPVVQDGRDSFSASFEFEGELVPA